MRIVLCAFMLFNPFQATALLSNGETKSKNDVSFIQEDSNIFKSVQVAGSNGNYLITGKTKPSKGKFYYLVEDGHVEYIKETLILIKEKNPNWQPFKIQIRIPKEKLPNNGSLLVYLYERNNEEQIINSFPIILQRFY
ncbi:C2 domain-containing protein [Neobacillus ginsengisoli]|uniref:Intracellular proteinase inhibitor n=1 Tax=Neobacillus ginsengisoli TaxID=904295 RepID=A0ABT9XRG6_9BACI|nr:intracellular proteinase inhibitor [Neobacillus ginsengisoli]MDQ0198152.1 hypothetical protein [Neobacillus ginsengisoli]